MNKYIGNIIVNSPNTKIDICFNKCLSISNINNELPTLIIGLQNAKSIIGDFNILKKNYNNKMLWWTFSKTERRVDYDNDIEEFKNFCINNIVNKIEYKNIDIVNIDCYSKIKKLITFINNTRKKNYYIDSNKFIFIYDKERDNMKKFFYGFSLNTAAFFGISKKKVLSFLTKNKNNIEIKNFYSIPNNIRRMVNDDIPSEIILLEYFKN